MTRAAAFVGGYLLAVAVIVGVAVAAGGRRR